MFKSLSMLMVTDADGHAGMRCWRKRMRPCNGVDRDLTFFFKLVIPSERSADFPGGCNAPQVLLGKDEFVNF